MLYTYHMLLPKILSIHFFSKLQVFVFFCFCLFVCHTSISIRGNVGAQCLQRFFDEAEFSEHKQEVGSAASVQNPPMIHMVKMKRHGNLITH